MISALPVSIFSSDFPAPLSSSGVTESVKALASELPEEKVRVKGGGFACALVKTSVFTELDYPWFQYVTKEDWSSLSEDYYFCQNANLFEVEIWMDPRVKCGHLARYYQYE